jgi:hypothetical protein
MGKGEISWKRNSAEGVKCQVYARRVGGRWDFYVRQRRFENWEMLERPPLEDWLTLLRAVERRAARRLVRPEEVERLVRRIREQFPEADLG